MESLHRERRFRAVALRASAALSIVALLIAALPLSVASASTSLPLDANPDRDALRARLDELFRIPSLGAMSKNGERVFFMRRDPENEQSVLYFKDGLDGEPKLLLDPDTLGEETRMGLDWWFPSVDGRLLAYGLSEEGSESSVLLVMDVDTGKLLPDRIPNTRAASLAWKREGGGFYYTRFPGPGEVPDAELFFHRKIYYHELGTDPAADPLVFGEGLDR
jgi:prolyl oligopeptidase